MKRNEKGQFVHRDTGERYGPYGVWYDAKGYPCICVGGKDIKLHVYVWEQKHGQKPKGMQLHHIDEDKSNYSLDNLMLVSQSDHFRIHAGWVRNNDGIWVAKPCTRCKEVLPLSSFYKRKGFTPSAQCKKCHCKATRVWAINNQAKRKEIALRHYYKSKEVQDA